MMDSKIANRYAKALLLVGQEKGDEHSYVQDFQSILNLMEESPMLKNTLESPLYAVNARKKVLEEVLKRVDISSPVKAFLLLVFDNGRIHFLASIADAYQRYVDEMDGILRAEVISAVPLTDPVITELQTSLGQRMQKKIHVTTEVNNTLIGGVLIQIGHTIMDGSLRMKLKNMKEALIQEN